MKIVQAADEGVKVIVPTGMLGSGISCEHVQYGVSQGAHAIAVDAGSTDSGPAYLAQAVSKVNRQAIARDLEVLMRLAGRANIPILIGSCGTCGADAMVDWTREIVVEIAKNLGTQPRIASIYSEQSKVRMKQKAREGKIEALEPCGDIDDAMIDACEHIVALMGPEPYMRAIQDGADIVLGGRTTDTAVLAAVPLMNGAGTAAAWHAAKISECGGLCTVRPTQGGVLMTVREDDFDIEPLSLSNRCTPRTASAHMLYETADPNRLLEPGGVLDVVAATYQSLNERVTRISGSTWIPMPYTMKLEGARSGPYQTIMLIGIEDPEVLKNVDEFEVRLKSCLIDRINATFGAQGKRFSVSLRIFGWNAISGRRRPAGTAAPVEVGLLFVVTAETQELANQMAKACNPYFFHFPASADSELPSYAFPFTPAEIPRGRVHEFLLNHVVAVTDGFELTRTDWFNWRHA